jgi:hypothetical protein
MATKIEQSLTPAQLAEFKRRAAELPGTLLSDLQALAAEFGIEVSLMGARSFRKGPFADYLAELKAKREMAEDISTVAKSGLGLADASATMLSQKIFDRLHNAETLSDDETDQLSLALSRIRTGDQRSKFLEAKLDEMRQKLEMAQFDAVQAAITHAKEIRSVTGDKSLDDSAKTERVRQLLFGTTPEGFTPIATTGDAR